MVTYRVIGAVIICLIAFQSCKSQIKKDSDKNMELGMVEEPHLDTDIVFIEYDKVISEIKSIKHPEEIEDKYDFLAILILDSSELPLLNGFVPDVTEDFNEHISSYISGLHFYKSTVGFLTEKKEIKEIFRDVRTVKRIIECTNIENSPDIVHDSIDKIVYVKGNRAVFSISGPTWSDTYLAVLADGIIQIKWLVGTIE